MRKQSRPQPVTDEQLWSWVDRAAPELEAYLEALPEERERVGELTRRLAGFSSLATSVEAEQLPSSIGAFTIKGLLGRGGMGTVFDAEQDSPRRRVALKVLLGPVALDRRRLELFRREADALARLSHPGIASIFEVGTSAEGTPFIAMERVVGRPLDRFVEEQQPSRRERLLLAQRLATALGHAHDQGVVHRDIKPNNVLIDARGEPVLVDFGLASLEDDERARLSLASTSGSLMGTLPYMSPEQIGGRSKVGPQSDVYSLGVLLFQLFEGRLPHELSGLSLAAAARRVEEQPPRRPRRRLGGLGRELTTILMKALEKRPERRYQSAGELAADLQRLLDGRPVHARRASLLRRGLGLARRHRLAVVLTGALVVIAAVFLRPSYLMFPLSGDWWRSGTPFEAIRWQGDRPDVRVEGQWYELLAIEGLQTDYLTGFCKQSAGERWRKRFSEDLLQVLDRLGVLATSHVDVQLRSLGGAAGVEHMQLPLSEALRLGIIEDRSAWPWVRQAWDQASHPVIFEGQERDLVSIDGVPIERLSGATLFDAYCDVVGHSPPVSLELVLDDPLTGTRMHFDSVLRRQDLASGGVSFSGEAQGPGVAPGAGR